MPTSCFDVRHLPNPHWQPDLRALTGMDKEVQDFLDSNDDVTEMYHDILAFLLKMVARILPPVIATI